MKCVFQSNSFNNVDVLLGTFSATIAMVAGMTIWMVSYSVLSNYIGITTISFGMQLLLCLVPIYNMCTGYVIIAAFESRGNFPFNLYHLKNPNLIQSLTQWGLYLTNWKGLDKLIFLFSAQLRCLVRLC